MDCRLSRKKKQEFIDDIVKDCIIRKSKGAKRIIINGKFHYEEIVTCLNLEVTGIPIHYGILAREGDYSVDLDWLASVKGLSG